MQQLSHWSHYFHICPPSVHSSRNSLSAVQLYTQNTSHLAQSNVQILTLTFKTFYQTWCSSVPWPHLPFSPITLANLRAFARPFLPSLPSLPTPSLTHSYTHTIPSYPHGERTVICKLTSTGNFFVSNEKGPWQFKHCLFFLVFFFYLKIVRIIANITEPTFQLWSEYNQAIFQLLVTQDHGSLTR